MFIFYSIIRREFVHKSIQFMYLNILESQEKIIFLIRQKSLLKNIVAEIKNIEKNRNIILRAVETLTNRNIYISVNKAIKEIKLRILLEKCYLNPIMLLQKYEKLQYCLDIENINNFPKEFENFIDFYKTKREQLSISPSNFQEFLFVEQIKILNQNNEKNLIPSNINHLLILLNRYKDNKKIKNLLNNILKKNEETRNVNTMEEDSNDE